jgi:hypothetical protein
MTYQSDAFTFQPMPVTGQQDINSREKMRHGNV